MTVEVLPDTKDLETHLKKWFGYNTFRSYQKEVVESILQGKDVLAILPTGAGKSLCYQLPAMLVPGTAVVVSPLISLMQDQVSALTKSGIPAAYVNSSLSLYDLNDILGNLSRYKLLYIAPERFSDLNFLQRLKEMPLSFFVIDEAHCISQWGHSFRPEYRQLSLIKTTFPDKPLMALTATATLEVEKDIAAQLMLNAPLLAKGSFDRPNLMIRVAAKTDADRQIDTFLEKHKNQSGIIYAATRKTVDSLHERLTKAGYKPGKYHAGLSNDERHEALHDFIHDKTILMVATVAFGMGINKPDIRFILHHDMPKTIEQYYQEIGRGGRDGLAAECLMLYSGKDLMTYRSFLKDITDPELRKQTEAKTSAMYSLCHSMKCRRIGLLRYFGETYLSHECNGCDNCVDEEEKIEGTVIAQKILSCVYRLNEGFGVRHVIDVLRGSKSSQVLSRDHDRLSTYNLMPECSEAELRYYIDSLTMLGLLKSSDGDYPVLKWTEASRDVASGQRKVEFRKKLLKGKAKEAPTLAYNNLLFEKLRDLRTTVAREEGIPPYSVFPDRSLYEMATYFPQCETEFLSINGVGRYKIQAYGNRFMQAIKGFCNEHNITPPQVVRELNVRTASVDVPPTTASDKESFRLFRQGKSFDEIAKIRGFTRGTVITHICQVIGTEPEVQGTFNIELAVTKERQEIINGGIDKVGLERLTPIKQVLPEEITFDEIRFIVAIRRGQEKARIGI